MALTLFFIVIWFDLALYLTALDFKILEKHNCIIDSDKDLRKSQTNAKILGKNISCTTSQRTTQEFRATSGRNLNPFTVRYALN